MTKHRSSKLPLALVPTLNLAIATPALSEDPAPWGFDAPSNVGLPYRAYRAGIGHTEAPYGRRPLDGSARTAPPAYVTQEAEPDVDWSGTYFGATVGGLMSSTELDGGISADVDTESYVVSGHTGTNYQIGAVVFGAELDLSGTDAATSKSTGGLTTKTELDWMGSARLRAGLALDKVLIYGTGGVAVTTTDTELQALGFRAESKEFHTGYVVGGGAELEIVDGINARVEALHYGFSGDTLQTPAGSASLDHDITTVRAGISLKFK